MENEGVARQNFFGVLPVPTGAPPFIIPDSSTAEIFIFLYIVLNFLIAIFLLFVHYCHGPSL